MTKAETIFRLRWSTWWWSRYWRKLQKCYMEACLLVALPRRHSVIHILSIYQSDFLSVYSVRLSNWLADLTDFLLVCLIDFVYLYVNLQAGRLVGQLTDRLSLTVSRSNRLPTRSLFRWGLYFVESRERTILALGAMFVRHRDKDRRCSRHGADVHELGTANLKCGYISNVLNWFSIVPRFHLFLCTGLNL